MPRNLPWKIEDAGFQASTPKTKAEPRSRRKVLSDSGDEDGLKAHQTSPVKKRLKREEHRDPRTPSTSPPLPPPPEEYMHPGYSQDDLYRMVEDEFYDAARQFTSHLHIAEYNRLKKQTKEKSFEAMLAMRRPTDGNTKLSLETTRKKDALAQARKTDKGVKEITRGRIGGEDDLSEEENAPWIGTNLRGLMLGGERKSRALVGLESLRSDTKAAKGFGSPRKEKDKNAKSLFYSRTDGADADADYHTSRDGEGNRGPGAAKSHHTLQDSVDDQDEVESDDDLDAAPSRSIPSRITPSSTFETLEQRSSKVKAIFQSSSSPTRPSASPTLPTTTSTGTINGRSLGYNPPDRATHKNTLNSRLPSTSSNYSRSSVHRAFDAFDDLDGYDEKPTSTDRPSITRPTNLERNRDDRLPSDRKMKKQSPKDKGKGKARLDEIPLFL